MAQSNGALLGDIFIVAVGTAISFMLIRNCLVGTDYNQHSGDDASWGDDGSDGSYEELDIVEMYDADGCDDYEPELFPEAMYIQYPDNNYNQWGNLGEFMPPPIPNTNPHWGEISDIQRGYYQNYFL
jgi:hypothetical protein